MDVSRTLRKVGRRIAEIRQRADLTQEALAEKLGMDAREFQRIEAGERNITARRLILIAHALKVAPVALWQDPASDRRPKPGRPRRTR